MRWALFSDNDASSAYAERLLPQMKLMAAATELALSRGGPAPTRAQAEALVVSVWSTVVGYVAGNAFFWAALGRKAGPARHHAVREVLGALARGFQEGTRAG